MIERISVAYADVRLYCCSLTERRPKQKQWRALKSIMAGFSIAGACRRVKWQAEWLAYCKTAGNFRSNTSDFFTVNGKSGSFLIHNNEIPCSYYS